MYILCEMNFEVIRKEKGDDYEEARIFKKNHKNNLCTWNALQYVDVAVYCSC